MNNSIKSLSDVFVIDDLVPVEHSKYLESYFTGNEVDWFFQPDITYHQSHENFKNIKSHNVGFSNLIYNMGDTPGYLYHTMAPIMYAALNVLNITPLKLLKARAFMQLPTSNQENEVNNPHVDANIKHIVILYYITDADGDTLIYNETEESEEYTIMDRVQPKRGRCVVFDGRHYHSSSKPTNNIRATININVII